MGRARLGYSWSKRPAFIGPLEGVDVMLPWPKMASSHPWHIGGEAGCSGSAASVLLGVFSPAGGSGLQKPRAEAAGPATALLSRTFLAKAVTGQLGSRAEEVDPALVRRAGRGLMANFDPPSRPPPSFCRQFRAAPALRAPRGGKQCPLGCPVVVCALGRQVAWV